MKIDIFLQQCNQTICEGVIAFFYVQHLPVQSVPITTKVVSLNPVDGEMYSIQHYVIKFVWFSPGTPVSSTNKSDCHDITELLLKVALNTITLNQTYN